MTRKERIEDLQNQIYSKRKEISELENQIKSERVADFYERHNLSEGQHFLYRGKEYVGVEYDNLSFPKAHRIKKDGKPSTMSIYIYNEEEIKPI